MNVIYIYIKKKKWKKMFETFSTEWIVVALKPKIFI